MSSWTILLSGILARAYSSTIHSNEIGSGELGSGIDIGSGELGSGIIDKYSVSDFTFFDTIRVKIVPFNSHETCNEICSDFTFYDPHNTDAKGRLFQPIFDYMTVSQKRTYSCQTYMPPHSIANLQNSLQQAQIAIACGSDSTTLYTAGECQEYNHPSIDPNGVCRACLARRYDFNCDEVLSNTIAVCSC